MKGGRQIKGANNSYQHRHQLNRRIRGTEPALRMQTGEAQLRTARALGFVAWDLVTVAIDLTGLLSREAL